MQDPHSTVSTSGWSSIPPLDDLVVSFLCVRLSTVEDISAMRRLLKPTLENITALQLERGGTLQLSSFGTLIEDVSAQLNSLAIGTTLGVRTS